MPFCRQCGNPTVESDQFCAKCGAVAPSGASGEPQANDARSPGRRRRVTIIVVAIVLAVVACALVFGLGRSRRDGVAVATRGTPTAAATATPATSPPEAAQGSTSLAGIGGSVTFYDSADPDFGLTATVDETKTLPPAKNESIWSDVPKYAYGVQLTVENTGQQSYDDDLSVTANSTLGIAGIVTLYDTDGNSYGWNDGGDYPDVLHHVHVLPGQSISGWVYFGSDNAITPLSFEFAPNDTQDNVAFKPGEWQLQ
jgi:hypothetical protein